MSREVQTERQKDRITPKDATVSDMGTVNMVLVWSPRCSGGEIVENPKSALKSHGSTRATVKKYDWIWGGVAKA